MIQDIFPKRLDNRWLPDMKPKASDFVLSFDGRKVLVKISSVDCSQSIYTLPRVSDTNDIPLRYLFRIDDEAFFLGEIIPFPGTEYADMNMLRENYLLPRHLLYAILTGKHLDTWYGNTRFCGKCGSIMQHSSHERAMVCPSCHNTVYPRIMPAVIVGVRNKDCLLLTRYREGYPHNALIAGFTEIGETLEETVMREVMEEAGIRVKNITYYKSQPWGIASDILTGFYCDVDGDDTIKMDSNELKYASWVRRSDIVLQPDDASLTNEMMKMFKDGLI